MVDRIQNRNTGYTDSWFSKNTTVENTTYNSIDGATALKLDEKFEINVQEENAAISKIDTSIPAPEIDNLKNETEFEDNIPTGVSIESASYMENNIDESTLSENENNDLNNAKEDYTPKLFSDDDQGDDFNGDTHNEPHTEKLFDQDLNEEEDFEIPAFLRKQKF